MTTKEIERAFDISNMLPNRVLKDDAEILQFIKHCVGISKAFTESFTIDKSVLEDIKAEIESIEIHGQIDAKTSFIRTADQVKNMVLEIIDKHIGKGGAE